MATETDLTCTWANKTVSFDRKDNKATKLIWMDRMTAISVLPSIPVPTKGKPTPTTANSIEH